MPDLSGRAATNLAMKKSNIHFGEEPKVDYTSEFKEKFITQVKNTEGHTGKDM